MNPLTNGPAMRTAHSVILRRTCQRLYITQNRDNVLTHINQLSSAHRISFLSRWLRAGYSRALSPFNRGRNARIPITLTTPSWRHQRRHHQQLELPTKYQWASSHHRKRPREPYIETITRVLPKPLTNGRQESKSPVHSILVLAATGMTVLGYLCHDTAREFSQSALYCWQTT